MGEVELGNGVSPLRPCDHAQVKGGDERLLVGAPVLLNLGHDLLN